MACTVSKTAPDGVDTQSIESNGSTMRGPDGGVLRYANSYVDLSLLGEVNWYQLDFGKPSGMTRDDFNAFTDDAVQHTISAGEQLVMAVLYEKSGVMVEPDGATIDFCLPFNIGGVSIPNPFADRTPFDGSQYRLFLVTFTVTDQPLAVNPQVRAWSFPTFSEAIGSALMLIVAAISIAALWGVATGKVQFPELVAGLQSILTIPGKNLAEASSGLVLPILAFAVVAWAASGGNGLGGILRGNVGTKVPLAGGGSFGGGVGVGGAPPPMYTP